MALNNVRRVPQDELLALRQKGGTNDGFRDAPTSVYPERFKYCLVNDSGDLSRAAKRKHDVSHNDALVLLHPDSLAAAPLRWVIPSAADFGQPHDGKLKLSVKYKTLCHWAAAARAWFCRPLPLRLAMAAAARDRPSATLPL